MNKISKLKLTLMEWKEKILDEIEQVEAQIKVEKDPDTLLDLKLKDTILHTQFGQIEMTLKTIRLLRDEKARIKVKELTNYMKEGSDKEREKPKLKIVS